jgi:hypothetical protein
VVGGGKVYGATHASPTPLKLGQAILDAEAAYTDAKGRPCTNVGLVDLVGT